MYAQVLNKSKKQKKIKDFFLFIPWLVLINLFKKLYDQEGEALHRKIKKYQILKFDSFDVKKNSADKKIDKQKFCHIEVTYRRKKWLRNQD